MLLSEHIRECQELFDLHGDQECYTAKDAEGNGYEPVYYGPGAVFVRNEDNELEVIPEGNWEEIIEDDPDMKDELIVNGIILN